MKPGGKRTYAECYVDRMSRELARSR